MVVRRPYLLFYRSARDPIERSIINLSTAVVEYSADKQVQTHIFSHANMFEQFEVQTLWALVLGNKAKFIRTAIRPSLKTLKIS